VVDFDVVRSLAEFASALEQSFDQLLVGVERPVWLTVEEDRRLLPFERDAAEPSDQWVPAVSRSGGFEARA
jgi:hypothetical protein